MFQKYDAWYAKHRQVEQKLLEQEYEKLQLLCELSSSVIDTFEYETEEEATGFYEKLLLHMDSRTRRTLRMKFQKDYFDVDALYQFEAARSGVYTQYYKLPHQNEKFIEIEKHGVTIYITSYLDFRQTPLQQQLFQGCRQSIHQATGLPVYYVSYHNEEDDLEEFAPYLFDKPSWSYNIYDIDGTLFIAELFEEKRGKIPFTTLRF